MLFGYVYTQNSNKSEHPLREVIDFSASEGCQIIRSSDDDEDADWDSEAQKLKLDLEPSTSDLVVFLHSAPKVALTITSHLILRHLTKEELMEKTVQEGDAKAIPGTQCTLRTYKGPHSYGVFVSNAEGPAEETVQLFLKFNKVNYRIEG